jgi:hypothetical protein
MHMEKNVCDNILCTLLSIKGKTKDDVNARLDIVKLRPMLNATKRKNGKYEYRTSCYKLSRDEKLEVLEFLFTLRFPSCYSRNIRSFVDMPGKELNSMKSHDCHVMMTQILLVAIRNVLPKPDRETLMRLCLFSNTISPKVIKLDTLDGMQE